MASDSPWPTPNLCSPQPPALASPQVITQNELRRLQTLLCQRRDADRLRKSILERLRTGANIESGSLTVQIEEKWIRQITRTALEGIWGTEYVESLRQHVPETVQRHLRVVDQSNQAEM